MVDFSSARSKIERAKAHTAELEREVAVFFNRRPYRLTKKMDFETEQFGYGLSVATIPASVSLILGDAVHNLRTALDHLICATVADQGKTIRDSSFPFAHSKAELEESIRRKARKAPEAIKDLCRRIGPYPGGDEKLVALHELDLIDKHQLVIAVAAAGEFKRRYLERERHPEKMISKDIYLLGAEPQFIPSAEGYEGEIPFEIGIAVEVVFPTDGPMGGQRCTEALAALTDRVLDIADLFQTAYP